MKLFDSELKVMSVLWRLGDRTAKEISNILKDETGWNQNTTYTVIKNASLRGPSSGRNRIFSATPWFLRPKSRTLKRMNSSANFLTAPRICCSHP